MKQYFVTSMSLYRLTWMDENLSWKDHEEFADLSQIHFGHDEIWRPDILLYNNADESRYSVSREI